MTEPTGLRAYERLKKDYSQEYEETATGLSNLSKLSKHLSGPLYQDIKPVIALCMQWKFDYLAKTRQSPFDLRRDIEHWTDTLTMMSGLEDQGWLETVSSAAVNSESPPEHGAFDFMWPRTTVGSGYDVSQRMAEYRMHQIVAMIDGSENPLRGKHILDSGCGPGRYIEAVSRYAPDRIVGLDIGLNILNEARKRFDQNGNVEFIHGSSAQIPEQDGSFDFVISNGVLHHIDAPMEQLVAEHARVVRDDGHMFIFIAGESGLELELWQFLIDFLWDVDIQTQYSRWRDKISPLRLQGLLDHGYAGYEQTSREDLETWLSSAFSHVEQVPGIDGLDVTPQTFADDAYFEYRFGSGNLRYLCKK